MKAEIPLTHETPFDQAYAGTIKATKEVSGVAKKATEQKLTADNVEKISEILCRLRAADKVVTEIYSEYVENIAPNLKGADSIKKNLGSEIKRLDAALAEPVLAYFREHNLTSIEGALGSSITMASRSVEYKIEDVEKIPERFFRVPEPAELVDIIAVKAAIENGEEVPGIKVEPRYYLTTRAATILSSKE